MKALQPQELSYDGIHCSLILQRFLPRVVVLRISGSDVGEFGEAPMDALHGWIAGAGPIQLFVDAREVRGASMGVSAEWARWLGAHKPQLQAVTMLTGSRFVHMTAEFVRRFSDLEGVMRICTEPEVFDSALAEALQPE
jgi:hypothetical protein